MVCGMAAAGVLVDLSAKIDLRPVNDYAFQRRQTSIPPPPPQCATTCDPVNPIIASNVSDITYTTTNLMR